MRSKKVFIVLVALTVFSGLYCQDDAKKKVPFIPGLNDSGAAGNSDGGQTVSGSGDSGGKTGTGAPATKTETGSTVSQTGTGTSTAQTGTGGSATLPATDTTTAQTGTGGSGAQTGAGGSPLYYEEPNGDDSCAGCPGQLGSDTLSRLRNQLSKAGLPDAKIDLNVRVTIPLSENKYADKQVDLWATVIRPTNQKLPTIVVATPYRREMMMLLYIPLVSHNYNLMAIDIRGTGSSGGQWTSFDLVEQYDIKYVVDSFIPGRVWSDGSVGMIGPSYMAIIQLLTAGLIDTDPQTGEPVHLKALFPLVPMSDTYRDIVMHGGNCDMLFIPLWLGIVDILAILPSLQNLGVNGPPSQADFDQARATWEAHVQQIPQTIGWIMDAANLNDGPFYDKKSSMIYWPMKPKNGWGFYEGDNKTIPAGLPVFSVGGWFDIFTRGTTNTYQYGLSKHRSSDKKMIIGEYYHISGSLGMGLNSIMTGALPARWFDWKIKKKQDPFMEEYPVLLYVMGEQKWRAEKSWPLPESRVGRKSLYLTKRNPSPIPGDWYSDEPWWLLIKNYTDNDYGLSEAPDYSGDNPVLRHNPLDLHGIISRSSTRWTMGIPALVSDASKNFMDKNIDPSMPFEDERFDEKECLTFTTEPLADDMEIVGPVSLTFWARTTFADPLTQAVIGGLFDLVKSTLKIDDNLLLDGMNKKDVQWVAEMNDVFPDGRARNITSGWLSAWHRQYDPAGKTTVYYEGPWWNRQKVVEHALDPAYVPFDPFYDGPDKNPQAIAAGELYQYTIELWPTCNVFKKGHRVRLSVSASDFPHLLPIVQPSENTIRIDERHAARMDFTSTNTLGEGDTWDWIGSNADADKYLMSGGATGCGSPAVAASDRGSAIGIFSEVLGMLFIMMIPMIGIMLQRYFRRKKEDA